MPPETVLTDQTIHYIYRALVAPLLNPSMSPIHPLVWGTAVAFQLINATSIGGWLGGYGPTVKNDWTGHFAWIQVGLMLWAFGLLGNMFHDDELREIRRAAARQQRRREEAQGEGAKTGQGVDKVYMMPQNGLFGLVLYPHYLCEWIEWTGFWMVGGLGCVPARSFLLNEVATMVPRALAGRRWYVRRFGREAVGSRRAVVPGLL